MGVSRCTHTRIYKYIRTHVKNLNTCGSVQLALCVTRVEFAGVGGLEEMRCIQNGVIALHVRT